MSGKIPYDSEGNPQAILSKKARHSPVCVELTRLSRELDAEWTAERWHEQYGPLAKKISSVHRRLLDEQVACPGCLMKRRTAIKNSAKRARS